MAPWDFISVVHPRTARAKVIVMLKAFFDESGIDERPKVLAIAGFIADVDVWADFTGKWASALTTPKHEPMTEFKTYDCVHGVGEFSVPRWSFADRLAVAGGLVNIIADTDMMAIGSCVVKEQLKPWLEIDYFRDKVSHPYYLCFEHCIQMAINWTRKYSQAAGRKERVTLVFDENEEFSIEAGKAYNNYKNSQEWGDDVISMSFLSSKASPALQAADLIAYGTSNLALKKYYPDLAGPDFPIGPVFDRMISEVARAGGTYDEESLSGLVNHMIEVDTARLDAARNKINVP